MRPWNPNMKSTGRPGELNPGSYDRPSRSVRTVSQPTEPPRQASCIVIHLWIHQICARMISVINTEANTLFWDVYICNKRYNNLNASLTYRRPECFQTIIRTRFLHPQASWLFGVFRLKTTPLLLLQLCVCICNTMKTSHGVQMHHSRFSALQYINTTLRASAGAVIPHSRGAVNSINTSRVSNGIQNSLISAMSIMAEHHYTAR